MAASSLEIVNDALILLGAAPVGSLTENSDRARQANALYDKSRRAVLRDHPWNCALVRTRLKAYTEPAATLTPGAGATVVGTLVTFTASADVFQASHVGRRLWGHETRGKATIVAFTSATVVTARIDEAWDGVALAAGEWRLYGPQPGHTYLHTFDLPADCIRPVVQEPELVLYPFKMEGRTIISDVDEIPFTYVRDLTDTTLFDAKFEEALVHHLASKLAYPVTGKVGVARDMQNLYLGKLAEARAADAMEEHPNRFADEVLIVVRNTPAGPDRFWGPLPPGEPR